VGGPVTFSGGDVTLADAANTIASTLKVTGDTKVIANGLNFTAGTYTGVGVRVDATTGTITIAGAATDLLALGNNEAQDAKLLTLVDGAFALSGGAGVTVTLSGIGDGAIVVAPGPSANGFFTIGAAAELNLGNGVIALGNNGIDAGILVLNNGGAKLSGFTFISGVTPPGPAAPLQDNAAAKQPSFTTTPPNSVLGNYYTDGVTITAGGGAYTYDPALTVLYGTITGAVSDTSYAGRPGHGGIINKDSDISK
jgi:hypothetical protein